MFTELLNKQVVCPDISILQFMYPDFKVIKTEFEIYPGEPFIYIGDIKWINKINKHLEPHIIVASTGEYNLADMMTLIELAYKKHNKRIPQYINNDLLSIWKPVGKDLYNKEFLYNWKHLWVNGSLIDKEINKNRLYIDLLNNINDPAKLLIGYLKNVNNSNSKYIESSFIDFMKNGMIKQSEDVLTGKNWMKAKQMIFYASYSKNVHKAMSKMFINGAGNENPQLRMYNILKNVLLGGNV